MKKYILWDEKDGPIPRGENGEYRSGGVLGVIGEDNVYLRAYAGRGRERIPSLEVHEQCRVVYSLSGEKHSDGSPFEYLVVRVE